VRRLLIAAAVLIAGPAQAVDYVQCEAMRTALVRVHSQMKSAVEYAKELSCRVIGDDATKPAGDYIKCMKGIPTTTVPDPTWRVVDTEKAYRKDIEKIVKDMKKAGCPMR